MTFRFPALALVVLTATSAAAQRVSFPSFTGPSAATVRNQIVGTVCDTADCVAATKTTTGGKPDWKKAKKESVQFFVTGSVVKRGKALSLDLFVFNKAGAPRARKSLPMDRNGTLSPKNLQAAMDLLSGAFGSKRAPPRPPDEVKPPPDEVKPPPKENGKAPTRPPDPPPTRVEKEKKAPPPEAETRGEPEVAAPKAKRKPAFLVIEAGVEVFTRKLEYSQVATSNLRRYDLPIYGQLSVGAQFYPLALVRDDLLAGLGVEFNVALAPWLQSRLASITEPFPTSALRIDALLRFNIQPVKSFPLVITPYAGLRTQSFTVSPLADGRRIDGLPNIAFVGLRVGLGLEVPLIVGRLDLFGRFGILPVFSSGEIISPAFFPNGGAFGIEGNAGLGVRILPFLQVRGSFEFSRYGLTFTTQPTDPYVAAGAADTYLGGKVVVRLSF
ncbi:MAG: hypothetical protein Q8L48_07405 [Archangium sp.]|nr:hypothetical protein [Archangium sp.]